MNVKDLSDCELLFILSKVDMRIDEEGKEFYFVKGNSDWSGLDIINEAKLRNLW